MDDDGTRLRVFREEDEEIKKYIRDRIESNMPQHAQ